MSGSGKTGKCETKCKPTVAITAAIEVPKEDETALMTAIAGQPISLSVDAEGNPWQVYAGGIANWPGSLSLYNGKHSVDKNLHLLAHEIGHNYGFDHATIAVRVGEAYQPALCANPP